MATNPTDEMQNLEEKDVKWSVRQSWYEYLSANDLAKQQAQEEIVAQVVF